MTQGTTLRLIPALLAIAFSGTAAASGFQLTEQNAAGVGTAFAGAAATAEDASTIFYNPAGMTYLAEGHNISAAGTLLDRTTKFKDEGTRAVTPLMPKGDDGGNGGGIHLIPALYYAYSINPDLRIGLGISPTFADETKYSNSFIGRFSGKEISIRNINVNPSVAYRVNDRLSLGFGVNFVTSEVKFVQAVPTGLATESLAKLKGDDNAWGYNAGLMFQLTQDTRVGLSYRSRVKFHLEGTQTGPASIYNGSAKATLETPDTASLAVSHRLNDRWTLLADYTWTGWSSLQKLSPLRKDTGAASTYPLEFNFKDTYRVGIGATYQLNNDWKLRFGTAYDKNPIPDAASRTMTVPDGDRIWLAMGARWNVSPKTSVDFGYAHLFVKDTQTERVAHLGVLGNQVVRGKFENTADMISAQVNFNF